MMRRLTPAVALEAITLSAGEPDSVVTAIVVRVIAAGSAPAASRARVSTGCSRRRWPSAGAAARGVRCDPLQHLERRRRGAGGERPLLQPYDGAGDPRGRADPRRRRGVAAAALGAQLERGGALLGDADDAERRLDAGNASCAIAPPSSSTNHGRDAAARSSSTAAGAAGPETSSSQPKESQTSWAGAKPCSSSRSTASQIPTSEPLSSRVPRPQIAPSSISAPNGGCCQGASLVDRHDVEVRHQHDRALGVAAGPVEEQGVVVDRG